MTPYAWGALAVGAVWIAGALVSWSLDPRALFRGEDGRASASKLQFLMWTATGVFSYVSVFAAAYGRAGWQARVTIPEELIAAMGLGVTSLIGAKAITTSQVATGRAVKTAATDASVSWLVTDDQGSLDLTKIQMLGWTFIAIGTYLIRTIGLVHHLPGGDVQLPSIDPGLVLLSGIGHAAYLGGKLVSTETPRLMGVSPPSGRAPLPVTITGNGLGTKEGASLILDGAPVAMFVSSWSRERIEVTLPPTRPDGTPWPKDRAVSLGLMSGGRFSANNIPFTFT